MPVTISQITSNNLSEYAEIPIRFTAKTKLKITLIDGGLGGMGFQEIAVKPHIKDYDEFEDSKPTDWPRLFGVSHWAFFMAHDGKKAVGAAAVAFNAPKVDMLDGRKDLAILWDIRVHPMYRNAGIGRQLFQKAAEWGRQKDCVQMKIETQNTNPGACRFYARQGCLLGEVHRFKYLNHPKTKDEVMLVWYLDLLKR